MIQAGASDLAVAEQGHDSLTARDRPTQEAALRQAAVINAALLKLTTAEIEGSDFTSYQSGIDAAIAALERARSTFQICVIEKRLAADVQRQHHARRAALPAREDEFAKTVSLLTEALVQFRDTNAEFADQVQTHTENMGRLIAVEDPRTLRSALEQELGDLKQSAITRRTEDARRLSRLSSQVDVLEQRLAEAVQQATRDALTGLANRAGWDQCIAELTRSLAAGKQDVGVAMIDLDNFKAINDTHGHLAGDTVLRAFARLRGRAFERAAFVARSGGDEFAARTPCASVSAAVAQINRLAALVQSASAAGECVPFSLSVGLAYASARDDAASLLKRADRALYAAKSQGRDRMMISAA